MDANSGLLYNMLDIFCTFFKDLGRSLDGRRLVENPKTPWKANISEGCGIRKNQKDVGRSKQNVGRQNAEKFSTESCGNIEN